MNNKKKIRNIILYFLILIITALFCCSSIYFGEYLKNHFDSVSIRYENDIFTKQDLINALQNESAKNDKVIPKLTAWSKKEISIIKNEIFDSENKVDVFEVFGDMSLVITSKLLCGNYVNPSDYEGCVLDQYTAYKLFGSTDIIGKLVKLDNTEYIIRGIIKTNDPIMLIQVKDSYHKFSSIEMVFSDKENGKSLAEKFIILNNLPPSYITIEYSFTIYLLQILLLIPCWYLLILMIVKLIKILLETKIKLYKEIIFSILLILIAAILIINSGFQIHIPERLIPNRWSDFGFWVNKYSEFKNNLKIAGYLKPLPKDIIFNYYLKLYITSTIIYSICIVFISRKSFYLKLILIFKANSSYSEITPKY